MFIIYVDICSARTHMRTCTLVGQMEINSQTCGPPTDYYYYICIFLIIFFIVLLFFLIRNYLWPIHMDIHILHIHTPATYTHTATCYRNRNNITSSFRSLAQNQMNWQRGMRKNRWAAAAKPMYICICV